MASEPDTEEIFEWQEGVVPGWTLSKSTKEFHPNDNKLKIETHLCTNYNTLILSGKTLDNKKILQHYSQPYEKDLCKFSSDKTLLVNGHKVIENRGSNISPHDQRHTVVAVNRKYFAKMLLVFKNKIDGDIKQIIEESVHKVLTDNYECLIQEEVEKTFSCAIFYEKIHLPGVEMATVKECIAKFCHHLKHSDVYKTPISVLALKPKHSISHQPTETGKYVMEERAETTSPSTANLAVPLTKTETNVAEKSNDQQISVHIASVSREERTESLGPEHQTMVGSSVALSHHGGAPEELENPQFSTSGDEAVFHNCTLESEYKSSCLRHQEKKSQYSTQSEDCRLPMETKLMVSKHKNEKGNSLYSYTVNSNLTDTTPENGQRSSSAVSSCSSRFSYESYQILTKCHHYPAGDHETSSVSSAVSSTSLDNQISCDYTCYQNHEYYPTLPIDMEDSTSTLMQNSDTRNIAEKEINKCKSHGIKSAESFALHNQNLSTEQYVSGNEMLLAAGLTTTTNYDNLVSYGDNQDFMNGSYQQILKNSEINRKDLMETERRNHMITESLTRKNIYMSEKNKNCRRHSVHNHKDYSSQTTCKDIGINYNVKNKNSSSKMNRSNRTMVSLVLKPVKSELDPSGIGRQYYGVSNFKLKEKVVILLGLSGSGKTTLVNFIASYFLCAKSADDLSVCEDINLICVEPCTTAITAYTFCTDENDVPITVIDTPGINDSSRTAVDANIQSLKSFLENAASNHLEIHAIGFVVPAHQVRLTSSERLILNYLPSLFGQGVAHHLLTFVTAADRLETPPVVEAMRNCNVKTKGFFTFNNTGLANSTKKLDEFDQVYWRMGCKSWYKCLKLLRELPQLTINAFKIMQSKIYEGKVIDSIARDLKAELYMFIKSYKDSKHMNKEIFEKCEKVWELAAVINHLNVTQGSSGSDVESVLKTFVNEICKNNNYDSKYCFDLIFLGRSKGLLGAGIGVICSMGPLYELAKKSPKANESTKKAPSILYCSKCKKDHKIERKVFSGLMSMIYGLGMSDKLITFNCSECKCDCYFHEEISERKSHTSFDLPSEQLLNNTKIALAKIVQEKSFPGQKIREDCYLHFVNIALDYKYKMLIEDLLIM